MIAWNPIFAGGYDSPWGLLQKLSWLNCMSPPALLRSVANLSVPISDLSCHHRQFVDTRWLLRDNKGEQPIQVDEGMPGAFPSLADTLHARGGGSLFNGLARTLLVSDQLRFCPQCIRQGYHSTIHQIAGLARCPLHGVPLIDRCLKCSTRLPMFALRRDAQFRCPRCDVSWLEPDDLLPRISDEWRRQEESTFGAIVRWIDGIAQLPYAWHGWNDQIPQYWFRTSVEDDTAAISYSAAAVWFLHHIRAFPLDPALLAPCPIGIRVQTFNLKPKERFAAHRESRTTTSRQVYAAAERHIRTHLLSAHQECLQDAMGLIRTEYIRCRTCSFDPLLCPVAHGYVLWKHRVKYWLEAADWWDGKWRYLTASEARSRWYNLLSAFYACSQMLILMKGRLEVEGGDYWEMAEVGLDIEVDPWLFGWLGPLKGKTNRADKPTIEFILEDRDLLHTSRCNRGLARQVWLEEQHARVEAVRAAFERIRGHAGPAA